MSNTETPALTQPASPEAMQSFNSPVQVLKEFSSTQRSGQLKVYSDKTLWNFYFQDGRLRCASNATQSLSSLDYHFRCLGLKDAVAALKEMPVPGGSTLVHASGDWLQDASISQVIYLLQAEGCFDAMQMMKLLENLTKEALESFLWLTEGHYQWIPGEWKLACKQAQNVQLDLADLVQYFQTRQRIWQQMGDLIRSPHQRPYLFGHEQGEISPESSPLGKLSQLLRGLTLRQMALILNEDELKVAKLLYPYIQRGDVYLRDPKPPLDALPFVPAAGLESVSPGTTTPKTYKIACIDDSPTILDEMQKFLGSEEYEVTKITDPVRAASLLFRLKPDLVLMDITMPEINGYKLCSLLRGSVALRETPIIMVTGRTGIIDKARAKMNGATDYLVKPFTRGGLLSIVEKYLK